MDKLIKKASATTAFILVMGLYAGMVGAHGKESLEQDICVRGGSGSMVHLSTYQPQNEPNAQYCTEIPKEGETFLVVDLIDQALRNMPVAMRVVRGTSETEGETVSLLHADYHPDGVIGGRTSLNQGLYTVFITGESVPPVRYQYPLRVQQINYVEVARSAMGPLIASLLLTVLGYKLVKSKRVQNWLDSRRS